MNSVCSKSTIQNINTKKILISLTDCICIWMRVFPCRIHIYGAKEELKSTQFRFVFIFLDSFLVNSFKISRRSLALEIKYFDRLSPCPFEIDMYALHIRPRIRWDRFGYVFYDYENHYMSNVHVLNTWASCLLRVRQHFHSDTSR